VISLFDAGFLHILFDDRARVPRDSRGKLIVDRAQDRIDFLVQRISEQRDKIILPAPALTEFMLLAADRWVDYLTIIRRRSVFEIAGYDEPEAVELVEHWLKHGDGRKLKASAPETWAKLKYDRQIVAIAVTRRVERIYSTDSDLHKFAKQLNINSYDIKDLPLPPTTQPSFPEFEESSADKPREEAPIPPPADVRGSGDGHPEDQADAKAAKEKANGE
jgi:predicted nucleic acid-binding protein